jgi:hypothetical protein
MAYVLLVIKRNNNLNLKLMITPKVTNCKDCAEIPPLISDINCAIFNLSLKMYNNIIFSLNLNIDYMSIIDLLNYKRILEYKLVNSDYCCEFSVNSIATKVKLLKYK